jgi:hypothetical protein
LVEILILVAIFGALIALHSRGFNSVAATVFLIAVLAGSSVLLVYVKARADVRDALIAGSDCCMGAHWTSDLPP